MEDNDQKKWESRASLLHGEQVEADLRDDEDLKAAEKIFKVRGKVSQVLKLRTPEAAWDDLAGRVLSKRRTPEFLKYAAVFLLSVLLTGSAFWFYSVKQGGTSEFASISAPNGQISNITLFDGTNVWLNAGSSLTYKSSFNQNNREVILEGEALFSVQKNGKIPFIVRAGNAQVKVYGTNFNVKAYQNDDRIETVLIEGQVHFISEEKSVEMKPGERLLFSKTNGEIETSQVNTNEYVSWTGGKIYFNDETLENLVVQLSRWYEVEFSFEEERIKSYRFSGVINREKSLGYTLNIIQEINKVRFEFDQEKIRIKEKK